MRNADSSQSCITSSKKHFTKSWVTSLLADRLVLLLLACWMSNKGTLMQTHPNSSGALPRSPAGKFDMQNVTLITCWVLRGWGVANSLSRMACSHVIRLTGVLTHLGCPFGTLAWGELGFRSSQQHLWSQTCLWLKRTGLRLSDLTFQCFHLCRCELLIRNSLRTQQTASCLAYVGVNYSNYYIPFATSDSAQRNLPEVMGQGAFDSAPSAGFGEETSELCFWICGWDSFKTLARTFKHPCGSHFLCVKQEEQWELCGRDEFLIVCSLTGEALRARECKGPHHFQFGTSATTPLAGEALMASLGYDNQEEQRDPHLCWKML